MRNYSGCGSTPEPSRKRHLLVLAAAALALVVLLGAAMSIIGLVTSDSANVADNSQATSTSSTDGPSSPSGSEEQAPINPGIWETHPDTGLPIGAAMREGHPVGFPGTEAGAAAMVIELARAQIGLDYDTALTTIRVYAAPEDQEFYDALATAAVDQRRRDLGVPTRQRPGFIEGGEVNAPVGYAQTPIGYQVEEYGPDYYLVSVLNEVTATTITGQVNSTAYVGQQFVRWTPTSQDGAGDWQLAEPSDADRTQLAATTVPAVADLGSTAFQQAGWRALLQANGPILDSRTSVDADNDAATGDPS